MNHETKQLAADMVAQQITAYDGQLASLQEQLRQTEARIEAVKLMRAALMPLLGDRTPPATATSGGGGSNGKSISGGVGTALVVDSSTPANLSPDNLIRTAPGTGFADAVRTVLKDHPRGLAPSDVAEQMKTRGSASIYSGKTPFNTRVGNELHRLLKSGEVGRRAGRYYLTTQEQHA
jgi:hypothetical protein